MFRVRRAGTMNVEDPTTPEPQWTRVVVVFDPQGNDRRFTNMIIYLWPMRKPF